MSFKFAIKNQAFLDNGFSSIAFQISKSAYTRSGSVRNNPFGAT